jgi:uncharacterized membrane protein
MAAAGLAFSLFTGGVVLIVIGKRQAQAVIGFALCLASFAVVILSLKFYHTLIQLF